MRLKKIDIHVHSTPGKFVEKLTGGTYATPSEIRAIYDKIGVEKGLLLPSGINGECSHDVISMREAHDMVEKYSETLGWWFCNINPKMGRNNPSTDLSHFINNFKAHGARGVGECTTNLYFDDPLMLNLFYHCEKSNMPLLFHIGDMGNDYGIVDEPGLPRLEKILDMFPHLIFLGHSQKFWAEISGNCTKENRNGYPTGKVQPNGRIVELMRNYPNLYGDLSAGSGYNALSRDPEFAYQFIEEFQDRLFYGTDIYDPRNITDPMLKLADFLDDAMENNYISYEAYKKVSRSNAIKLLTTDFYENGRSY